MNRRQPISTAPAIVRELAREHLGVVLWEATALGADARGSGIILYRADGHVYAYSRDFIERRRRQEVAS